MDFKFSYSLENVRMGLPHSLALRMYVRPSSIRTQAWMCATRLYQHTPHLLLQLDYFLNPRTPDFRTCVSVAELSKHPNSPSAIQQQQSNTTSPIKIGEIVSPEDGPKYLSVFQNLSSEDRGC